MAHPMGESKRDGLRVDFDRGLRLEFHGSQIASDGGLLAYRELDDALGLTEISGDVIRDSRTGKNGWHGSSVSRYFGALAAMKGPSTPSLSTAEQN